MRIQVKMMMKLFIPILIGLLVSPVNFASNFDALDDGWNQEAENVLSKKHSTSSLVDNLEQAVRHADAHNTYVYGKAFLLAINRETGGSYHDRYNDVENLLLKSTQEIDNPLIATLLFDFDQPSISGFGSGCSYVASLKSAADQGYGLALYERAKLVATGQCSSEQDYIEALDLVNKAENAGYTSFDLRHTKEDLEQKVMLKGAQQVHSEKNIKEWLSSIFLWSLILTIVLIPILLLKRSVKKRRFVDNVEQMTFSRYDCEMSVDQEKRTVIVNGNEIGPAEFSFFAGEKTVTKTYDTGGYQTVYGAGGAIGSVYVPGQTGTYQETIAYIVRIGKSGVDIYSEEIPLNAKDRYEAFKEVLEKIQIWCLEQIRKDRARYDEKIDATAQSSFEALCRKANLESGYFYQFYWDGEGKLIDAIAVDRSGKAFAVYNNGVETWIGTLKGAAAQIIGERLEVKVDDPEYRDKYLSERRLSVLTTRRDSTKVNQSRELLLEWEDRINLIAKKVS